MKEIDLSKMKLPRIKKERCPVCKKIKDPFGGIVNRDGKSFYFCSDICYSKYIIIHKKYFKKNYSEYKEMIDGAENILSKHKKGG